MIALKLIEAWCNKHNATLTVMGANGFEYMTSNGIVWYVSYEHLLEGGELK